MMDFLTIYLICSTVSILSLNLLTSILYVKGRQKLAVKGIKDMSEINNVYKECFLLKKSTVIDYAGDNLEKVRIINQLDTS